MKRLLRLFSKSPADLLSQGDRHLASAGYFEARTCYEDALQKCADDASAAEMKTTLLERITRANTKLAERNLQEAEFAHDRGEVSRALDHLELVKTLTYDALLLEKAEELHQAYSVFEDTHDEMIPTSSSTCGSCSHGSAPEEAPPFHDTLAPHEYYELLIRQLPDDQYQRYSALGEKFAYAYLAASHDSHLDALNSFELCSDTIPGDIYWCEKGKVLHRLGRIPEAEHAFRASIESNRLNAFAWLNLALLLQEGDRFQEIQPVLETMIADGFFADMARLMRADVQVALGDLDGAIELYVDLLSSSVKTSAAEKLHQLLIEMERHNDAAVIFKKYMGKCCH
jgi:tetratricopeptide (TPR) repeat protein